MSNLAFQWLYHQLNISDTFTAERIVFPQKQEEDIYLNRNSQLLTLGSALPGSNMLAWFVTISFENDYSNFVRLMELAHIEPWAKKRRADSPLIVVGGTAPTLNPEPIAPFTDVFLLGEGNAVLLPFLEKLAKDYSNEKKDDFYKSLAKAPFAYVPKFYKPKYGPKKTPVGMTTEKPFSQSLVILKEDDFNRTDIHTHTFTPDTEFGDTYLLEAYRGCGSRCRFCAAGHLYLPPREYKADADFLSSVQFENLKMTGLVGAGVSAHSNLENLIKTATEKGRVGISSIRFNTLSDKSISLLANQGAKSAALAPETGSERLRRVCNKNITDDAIITQAARMIERGFENLKLYFMVGLPTETVDDVESIWRLTVRIKEKIMPIWKKRKRTGEIVVSVNPFIPKAHTPFQWAPFMEKKSFNSAKKLITKGLIKEGNIKVQFESYKASKLQAILSAGDQEAAKLILDLSHGKTLSQALASWQSPTKKSIHQQKNYDHTFPWSFIDAGFSPRYLSKEHGRAMSEKVTPECNVAKCTLCGICK